VWGVCAVLSAVFPTDSPPGIARHLTTHTGTAHTLIGNVGLLSFVAAVSLTARALRRHRRGGQRAASCCGPPSPPGAGPVVTDVSAAQMRMSGGPGPSSRFGIGERVLLAANLLWMLAIAKQAAKQAS
jgi:Protein of unknown function (DUF998)